MSKENLVFGLGGIIIGIIIGSILANQTPRRNPGDGTFVQQAATQPDEQNQLPEEHPQTDQTLLRKISEQEELLQRDPENQPAIVALADLNYDLNNHKEAIQWYEKALVKDPKNISLITDLGTSYLQTQNFNKALECFNKSLAMDPKHYQTLMNLGIAKMNTGDNDGAAEAWEKVIAYYPQDPNVGMLKDAVQKMKAKG